MHFLTTDYVISWLQTNFDIVFVTESHLIKGTRFSLPKFTPFHNPVSDKKPHGGISCFVQSSILHLITKVDKDIPETIIVYFVGGHRVFGNYIVPASSPFFDESYFTKIANRFFPKDSQFVVIGGGDLNARVGDIQQKLPPHCSYRKNIDETVNESGRMVRSICLSYNCFIVNNMNIGRFVCDGDFTFEMGGRKLQNDLLIANKSGLSSIREFSIHQIGWNPSDHTPISTVVDLDVTNHNLAVEVSYDINFEHNGAKIKKPKKIYSDPIDWERYKNLVENDYMQYDHTEPT